MSLMEETKNTVSAGKSKTKPNKPTEQIKKQNRTRSRTEQDQKEMINHSTNQQGGKKDKTVYRGKG